MKAWIIAASVIVAVCYPAVRTCCAKTAAVSASEPGRNRGIVQIETARADGISVRIAEDMANIVDDGVTRRVLPVVGKGALQNLTDLKLLRGIDMAILQVDVLDYARQQNIVSGIEYWASYITKLYNGSFISSRDEKSNLSLTLQIRRSMSTCAARGPRLLPSDCSTC